LANESAAGITLIAATALALLFSNTSLTALYATLLGTVAEIRIGTFAIEKPLLLWINDGLMAIFFFLVGLELKKEIKDGELSDWRRASLPVFAAVGGMAVPALIYAALNAGDSIALRGWAIPAATDIAFAIGILALLGSRVPVGLKVFLLALAIIDDLGAIAIIALFYTADLSLMALAVAIAGCGVLAVLNARGVDRLAPYVVVGAVIWVFLLKSGVHATLAGVAIALFVPHRAVGAPEASLLLKTEHALKPWVLFLIMPLFAFANAGVALGGLTVDDLFGSVAVGIALGLFLGKQIGIMAAVWLAVRLGIAHLPARAGWREIHGASLLAGIGFTMSLFIGTLAFADGGYSADVRIGVLMGSLASGIAGYLLLARSLGETRRTERDDTPVGGEVRT
jgi:NhaA family Na+:H+ antiporter